MRWASLREFRNLPAMWSYLAVAAGGALGSVARFWISTAMAERLGGAFSPRTIAVNVSGSLLIGLLATLTEAGGAWLVRPGAREFLMIGICGGYTTFSSFSLETLNLARRGEWLSASANIVLSVVLCLFAVWLGNIAGGTINRWRS